MADLNRLTHQTGSTWHSGDIRATNFLIRWRTLVGGMQSIVLMVLDALMLASAWTVADNIGTSVDAVHLFKSIVPIAIVGIGTLTASGLYSTDDKLHTLPKLFKSLTLAQLFLLIAAFFYHPGVWVSRSVFVLAWCLSLIFVSSARFIFDLAIVQIRKHNPIFQEPVFLLGNPAEVEKVEKLLARSRQFRIDGIMDLSDWNMDDQLEQIIARIRSRKVSEVFICSQQLVNDRILLFWNLKSAGIHLRVIPTELDLPQQSSETKMIEEIPTIRFKSLPIFGVNFWVKRAIDLVGASFITIAISPILLVIALLIRSTSPGPVFYRQYRVGLKGRHFRVWKFRTMVENAADLQQELESKNEIKGGVLFKIKDDPRITKIGKFLRRYSLDELPQLLNVLQGEMSLVGPRPLPLRDVAKFSKEQFLRHEVLPGITGLWQVKGRSNVDSEEVFYWDTIYILQWSLALDLSILMQTVRAVLTRDGAY
jgi:exopolysaccharide biosynthesis polyprenyl glycosylphosphotransferase